MKKVIAAIALPIISGLIILMAEYSYFIPQKTSEPSKSSSVNISNQATGKVTQPEELSVSASPDVIRLKLLHVTAKGISSGTTRDEELTNLARFATEKGEYELAVDIAKDIFSGNLRDKVLEGISCTTLRAEKIESAKKAAVSITSGSRRDEARKAIINRMISKDEMAELTCPKF